jgi:hypothetical protein
MSSSLALVPLEFDQCGPMAAIVKTVISPWYVAEVDNDVDDIRPPPGVGFAQESNWRSKVECGAVGDE